MSAFKILREFNLRETQSADRRYFVCARFRFRLSGLPCYQSCIQRRLSVPAERTWSGKWTLCNFRWTIIIRYLTLMRPGHPPAIPPKLVSPRWYLRGIYRSRDMSPRANPDRRPFCRYHFSREEAGTCSKTCLRFAITENATKQSSSASACITHICMIYIYYRAR